MLLDIAYDSHHSSLFVLLYVTQLIHTSGSGNMSLFNASRVWYLYYYVGNENLKSFVTCCC